MVDSGTSVLSAPVEQLEQLYALIGDVHGDCSNYDTLPDLVFHLGPSKSEFKLPPSTYVSNVGGHTCVPLFTESPLRRSEKHGPVWVLGQPFMHHYHVMYDRTG